MGQGEDNRNSVDTSRQVSPACRAHIESSRRFHSRGLINYCEIFKEGSLYASPASCLMNRFTATQPQQLLQTQSPPFSCQANFILKENIQSLIETIELRSIWSAYIDLNILMQMFGKASTIYIQTWKNNCLCTFELTVRESCYYCQRQPLLLLVTANYILLGQRPPPWPLSLLRVSFKPLHDPGYIDILNMGCEART